jgi:fructose-specific component phosphotransferase system IIB-like protein
MAHPKNKQEAQLQALMTAARARNVEVRMEKLLREVGYRVHSGRCRINGREVILLDRDAAISDQIEFLSNALAQEPTVSSESA